MNVCLFSIIFNLCNQPFKQQQSYVLKIAEIIFLISLSCDDQTQLSVLYNCMILEGPNTVVTEHPSMYST